MGFVRAYTSDDGNTLVTVSEAFAEGAGLHTVKDDALDVHGRPLPASEGYRNKTTAKSAAKNTTGGGNAASKKEA